MARAIDQDFIATHNAKRSEELDAAYSNLGERLSQRGLDIDSITARASSFAVALPTWGTGTGGTRFGRFPGPGEPTNIFEKLEDASAIHQLVACTPSISPHFPWDKVEDFTELREFADELGLAFDAVNSNTFQDQPGQSWSYKYGSLSHSDAAVRDKAVEHNIECIEYGRVLGSHSLTVWVGDGSNFPGQTDFRRQLERYLDSASRIYSALPDDWRMFLEHKMFEPAFYSTVIQDWGTSVLCAMQLGEKASSLVDLGHHAPNVNIEMIVSRLIQFRKLAGFHFNDSKYGDDDLDSGSIQPFQLFLVFNELVAAEEASYEDFDPAYMLDQSHNVTDPAESLIASAAEVQRAYTRALLVDRRALLEFQESNDAIMARSCLRDAFDTDVRCITAMARYRAGAAIDPVSCFRESRYRERAATKRRADTEFGGGIV